MQTQPIETERQIQSPTQIQVAKNSRFRPWMLEAAKACIRAGFNKKQVAQYLGVHEPQLSAWQNRHPELREAMEREANLAVIQVADALLARATGQAKKSTRKVITREDGTREVQETEETLPADVAAARYYLNNRAAKAWRERVETTGADGGPLQVSLSWAGGRGVVDAEDLEAREPGQNLAIDDQGKA